MRKLDPKRHEERRRQIIEAAGRCFARDGFRGATMAHICAEAGMSAGNVYYYFENKEAIVAARAQATLERWTEAFAQLIATAEAAPLTPSQVLAMSLRSELGERPLHFDILAEAGRNPAMAEITKRHGDAVRDQFASYIETAQAAGRVDPSLDPRMVAAVVLGLSQSAREWQARDPEFDAKAYLALLDRLAEGLAPRRA